MTRINTIIQGFVDLNLETDENISTNIVQSNLIVSNLKTNLIDKLEPPISIDKIIEIIGLNSSSVKSIHVQGSRLYGTDNLSSDWDLVIIATIQQAYQFKKFILDGIEYEIHLYSQEGFQSFLDRHDMREIEFLYHPPKSKLFDNLKINFEINNTKLIDRVKVESDYLWDKSKNELGVEGFDDYSSLKRIFHSIRFLIFAKQIIDSGEIVDFSVANYLYDPIVRSNETDFDYFETTYSSFRDQLKVNLDDNLNTNEFEGRQVLF